MTDITYINDAARDAAAERLDIVDLSDAEPWPGDWLVFLDAASMQGPVTRQHLAGGMDRLRGIAADGRRFAALVYGADVVELDFTEPAALAPAAH